MIVHPCSIQSGWVEANTDLQTADTANLLTPQLVTRAAVKWLEVPASCSRILIRGRNLATMSATGTPSAVLSFWGATGNPNRALAASATTSPWSTTPTGTNGGVFMRLDNADSGATGLTLTFATTGNLEDGTYEYTDLEATTGLTGLDLKGCAYVTALVATVCAVTGSAAVDCQFKFIN